MFGTLKVQSFILTEVRDCGFLIVVTSFLFFCFLFLCVLVCVYLCHMIYVRAYLAIPCVSTNNNVKHTKSNIRYDKKMKWNKSQIYKNSCIWVHRMDVRQQPFSSRQKAEIHKQILDKTWLRWQAMAPHPIPFPCALACPPPRHRDATTPSPCWAPHFMTQERIMFSNPTPSKPRLCPAETMSNDTTLALTPPLHCASILHNRVIVSFTDCMIEWITTQSSLHKIRDLLAIALSGFEVIMWIFYYTFQKSN